MFVHRRRPPYAAAAVAAGVVVFAVAVFVVARATAGSTHAGQPSPPLTAAPPDPDVTCSVAAHTPQGAATTAAAGLYQLALANMGDPTSSVKRAAAVEAILTRYVVAEQRPVMRQYLQANQSTLSEILSAPVAYQVAAYTDATAVVRLLVVDYGKAADATSHASVGVINATLDWDATQGFWRLSKWPGDATAAAVAQVAGDPHQFCIAANP